MREFGRKMLAEFRKMRVRTRVAICARVGMAVFLTIAGLAQIVYTADLDQYSLQPLRLLFIAVEN
ncbi:MAG: hypothetical protein P8Y61_09600 [Gammaproteobacteria bacterium]